MAPKTRVRAVEFVGRVAHVTAQAQKRRRLVQQVVGHRAVRIVAVGTVLSGRRMFPDERAFLFRMTLVAQVVQGIGLQIPSALAMAIVTVRADHFALPDRMVGRHRNFGENIGVALITDRRFIDAHRQSSATFHRGVTD